LIPLLSLLQLWDTVRGQLAFQHTCPKPLSCIAFHPEEQLIATGSWAGSISFFQVDGLNVIKVRKFCVAFGENRSGR
jgi:telomerase protein component 1